MTYFFQTSERWNKIKSQIKGLEPEYKTTNQMNVTFFRLGMSQEIIYAEYVDYFL